MKTVADARALAETMVGIGASHGTPVAALLTDMSQPLGRAVGNANEMAESVDILRGKGPEDVKALTIRFAVEMLLLAGARDIDEATADVLNAIESGSAFEVMIELTERQGGDPAVIEDTSLLPEASQEYLVVADRPGIVSQCDAFDIGIAGVRLGAGRATKEDQVDPSVGFVIEAKVGDPVEKGDVLARVAYNDESKLQSALDMLDKAWEISQEAVPPIDLILGEIR
jgi:thymidine phosphorylase